jgi:predicted 3-demethylubiquinone-9 3-methyltransferase (glyoxalase superfamily)
MNNNKMQSPKIFPCLWLLSGAEEAAKFYTSIFENSKITNTTHHGKATAEMAGMAEGSVLTVSIELEGIEFMLLNGGTEYKINPSISFVVRCKDQAEIDRLWDALLDGGEAMACGWLTDKYGVAWQIVPAVLDQMMQDPDPNKLARVLEAILPMIKLDVATMIKAFEGR